MMGCVLSVPGRHNVLNALAAAALARHAGVEPGTIAKALAGFEGVDRRMSFRGVLGGVGIGLVAGLIGLIVVADNLPRHEPKPESSPADDAEDRHEPVAGPDTVPETP